MTNTECLFNTEPTQTAVLSQQEMVTLYHLKSCHTFQFHMLGVNRRKFVVVHEYEYTATPRFSLWHKLLLLFMNMQYSVILRIFIV
jgi:hypothetical protein